MHTHAHTHTLTNVSIHNQRSSACVRRADNESLQVANQVDISPWSSPPFFSELTNCCLPFKSSRTSMSDPFLYFVLCCRMTEMKTANPKHVSIHLIKHWFTYIVKEKKLSNCQCSLSGKYMRMNNYTLLSERSKYMSGKRVNHPYLPIPVPREVDLHQHLYATAAVANLPPLIRHFTHLRLRSNDSD